MPKLFITNRKGLKISVLVEEAPSQKGLVFVMHGLGSFKESAHVAATAEAFKEKGCTAVSFDTTNALGESEGKIEDAAITTYYSDLEDVIMWAATQPWYQEPFALAGHSLGGISTALFAQNYPEKVLAVAPISTVVSGALSVEAGEKYEPEKIAAWRATGWDQKESVSKPGVIRRIPWSHMEDRLKYDLLPNAKKLIMPVLLVVGEKDVTTPPEHQQLLFNALPGPKELHIIKDATHTFRKVEHIQEYKQIVAAWIDTWLPA